MSQSKNKLFNTIGAKRYFWCMDHASQVNSVIRFTAVLIGPVAIIAIAELF